MTEVRWPQSLDDHEHRFTTENWTEIDAFADMQTPNVLAESGWHILVKMLCWPILAICVVGLIWAFLY